MKRIEKGFLGESQIEFLINKGYAHIVDLHKGGYGPMRIDQTEEIGSPLNFKIWQPEKDHPYFVYEVYGAALNSGKRLKKKFHAYFPEEKTFVRNYGNIGNWIPKPVKIGGKWTEIYNSDSGWIPIIHRPDLTDFQDIVIKISQLMSEINKKRLRK